ncbi:rRNA maturation RNase YbeY [Pusillimonas noertemannii]|uniref:rRNA maturation RNase YbeY n=1 Tax=Pusillimonas noertemannii TaxID=305977 RepID=UPI000317AF9F|nr:rRNA maturation RNase YbeY [Pusillimonas noertemannii]
MALELSLAVQYAEPAPQLPRWRLRRWVRRSLDVAGGTLPGLRAAALTLRLVGQEEGRELNLQYRERDYATNVLTFEYGMDPEGTVAGDIVLCLPVLEREAREQGKTLLNHAAHLTVHGVLHALGHDHLDAAEAREMEALETRILETLGIADPYA